MSFYVEAIYYIKSAPNDVMIIAKNVDKCKHMYSESESFNRFLSSSYDILKTIVAKVIDFLKWFATKALDMTERSLREVKNEVAYTVKLSKKGPPRILSNDKYIFTSIYDRYGGSDILEMCFNQIYNSDNLLSTEISRDFDMKSFFEDTMPELTQLLSTNDEMEPLMSKVAEAYYDVKSYTNNFLPGDAPYRFRCFLYKLFNQSDNAKFKNRVELLDINKYPRDMKAKEIINDMYFGNVETIYHGETQVRKLHDTLLDDVTKINSILMTSSSVLFNKIDKGVMFFKQVKHKMDNFENEYNRLVERAIAENEASNGNQYVQNIIEHMTYITTLTSYCTENIMRCYTLGEHIIIKECLLLHKAVEILNNMYNIYAV